MERPKPNPDQLQKRIDSLAKQVKGKTVADLLVFKQQQKPKQ